MQLEDAYAAAQAALDLALTRPGCMAVISPQALALVLADKKQEEGEASDGETDAQ